LLIILYINLNNLALKYLRGNSKLLNNEDGRTGNTILVDNYDELSYDSSLGHEYDIKTKADGGSDDGQVIAARVLL
jgi:hypothetical protein